MKANEIVDFVAQIINDNSLACKTYSTNGRLIIETADGDWLQLSVTGHKPKEICRVCHAIFNDKEEGPICKRCDR